MAMMRRVYDGVALSCDPLQAKRVVLDLQQREGEKKRDMLTLFMTHECHIERDPFYVFFVCTEPLKTCISLPIVEPVPVSVGLIYQWKYFD